MTETESITHIRDRRSRRSSPRPQIRVVLADDHDVMRRTLRGLLDSERDIEVLAEAGDLTAALHELREHAPHVLVLDLRLPAGPLDAVSNSGLELSALVRSDMPDIQVVLVTMQENEAFVSMAIEAGAIGFVRKDMAETELVDAVRAAARGERFTTSRVTRH